MSDKNVWTYALKTHKKGTNLIEEYKKYDNIIAEAQGLNDPDVDYIVYMEETTADDVDFGRVFLLKMSKIMIEAYGKGASREGQLKDLSDMLVENLKKNCPDFLNVIPDEYVVYEAFRQEIAYRGVEYGLDLEGKKALDHVNKQTEDDTAIIKSLRDLKFTREQYDPTLNSEQYLLKDLNNGIRWLLLKTGSIESKITSIKNYLEELNYFLWLDLDFLVSFFDKLLKFIGKLNVLIKNFKKYTNEGFPVICGLVNGLIEFVAGILDMIKLIVFRPLNLADAELFEHIELEFDMLVELLEEVVELFLKDPDKMLDKVEEAVENYWKERYQNKEVNIYQHNYFIGEDIVFAIDLVITVVTVVKGLTKISQKLPKFTKWFDDLFERRVNRKTNYKLSEEIIAKLPKKEILQKTSNIDDLYSDAAIANKELRKKTYDFASKNDGTAVMRPEDINNGLKSKERALEKVMGEYAGDASKILDIAGSKVVFERVDNLYDALGKFRKKFKILKFKDRIQKPLPTGYRDIIVNIEMSNGHIVEFKFVLKEMDDIAEGIGHKLYEEYRSLEAIGTTRRLTDNEVKKMLELIEEQKKVYNEAWNKIVLKN